VLAKQAAAAADFNAGEAVDSGHRAGRLL